MKKFLSDLKIPYRAQQVILWGVSKNGALKVQKILLQLVVRMIPHREETD